MTFGMLDGMPAEVVVDWPTTEDWTRMDVGWVIMVIVSVPVGTIEFGIEMVGVLTMTSGTMAADVLTAVVVGVDTGAARPLLETGTKVSVPVGVVEGLVTAVVVAAASPDVGVTEPVGVVVVSVPGVTLTPVPVRVGAAEEITSVGEGDTPVVAPVIPEVGKVGLATGTMLIGLPVGAADSAVDTSEMIAGTIGVPVVALPGEVAPVETAGSSPVPAPVNPELSKVVAAAGKETKVGAADKSVPEMMVDKPTMMAVGEVDAAGVAAAGVEDGCRIVSGITPVEPTTSGNIAGASELFAAGV